MAMWKKAWNDPVWSKVIAVAIIGAASITAPFFFGWWPAISSGVSVTIRFLVASTALPHWAILIMVLLSLTALLALGAMLWARIRPHATSSLPDWTSYTTDVFLGLRWKWTYIGTQMSNPAAFCPTCDYQIHPQRGRRRGSDTIIDFHCDSCSKTVASFTDSYGELKSKAERLAQKNIRNGSWPVRGGT
jgi:hypothetical protein